MGSSPVPEGMVLVPDDPDLLGLLALVDEPLMTLVCGGDPQEPDAWPLPAQIADPELSEAFARLYHAVTGTLAAARPRRMLAPDGRYEHMPLVLVPLAPTDLARLRAAARALVQAVSPGADNGAELEGLGHVLDEVAVACGLNADEQGRRSLVDPLTRLLAVLELTNAPQARPLLLRLAVAGADDIVLSGPEETAHRILAEQYSRLICPQDPALHRWAY